MKAYCGLPFKRLKIDADGSYQSCCHQTTYYGNFIKDNITIEEAFKGELLREVKNSVLGHSLHTSCNNKQCPFYYTSLEKNVGVELKPYPEQIELALPATWCNIGGLNPTPETACIMCPRSSISFMNNQPEVDYTDQLLEIIKPALPHLLTFTVLGIAEPFYKGRLFDIFEKIEFKKHKDHILFWTFCNGTVFGDLYQQMFLDYTSTSIFGFSIDAATPETYIKIRRLDYYKTITRNLENYFNLVNNLPEKRDWSFLTYNINLLNLHEMEDMVRFGNNIGAHHVQFNLTYKAGEGTAISKNLLCNKDNWPLFWEKQQRCQQLADELGFNLEFYVPFHGGFLK